MVYFISWRLINNTTDCKANVCEKTHKKRYMKRTQRKSKLMKFDLLWWQIGSFGGITRILNIVPNREDLLKIAAAGPLAGFSVGLVLLLLGFYLPPADGIGVIVDASVFHESFLAGGIGMSYPIYFFCHIIIYYVLFLN